MKNNKKKSASPKPLSGWRAKLREGVIHLFALPEGKIDETAHQPAASDSATTNKTQPPSRFERIQSSVARFFKMFVFFVVLTLVLMLLYALLPASIVAKPSWNWSWQETPLQKDANFQLHAGDWLDYELNDSNSSTLISLTLQYGASCPGVWMEDTTLAHQLYGDVGAAQLADPGVYEVCIGKDGNEHTGNGTILGSNISYTNVSWPYFQPWMLAAGDNFSWQARHLFTVMPINESSITIVDWQVVNHTTYLGRDAYNVELTAHAPAGQAPWAAAMSGADMGPTPNGGISNATDVNATNRIDLLIDAKERVLLWEQAGNTTIRLVNASFLKNLN